MKKIIITLIFLLSPLFSSEVEVASKIINKISLALTNKENISVYTGDIRNLYIIKLSENLKNVKVCEDADLVLTKSKDLPKCKANALIFATDYLAFRDIPEAVGAFFYQKGRPNIVFRKANLEKHNIVLSQEFKKYID